MSDWSSNQYKKFEKERTQPSVDLISRIDTSPKSILDIGCGPGNSTNRLFEYFPSADIVGADSSENMLIEAKKTYPNLSFRYTVIPDDLNNFGSFDLIFSNACLHWISKHEELLPQLMSKLNPNGILAVQMPLVQDADFYKTLNNVILKDKWKKLQSIKNFHNLSPNETYNILANVSSDITMWETTYYHILPSHNSVIDWYKGSGLRPYLNILTADEKEDFLAELLIKIQQLYPIQSDNSIILKMPRLFFTARK